MSGPEELSDLKELILRRVKTAAERGDVEEVARWSRVAERCEALRTEALALDRGIDNLRRSLEDGEVSGHASPEHSQIPLAKSSAKQQGAKIRAEWLRSLSRRGVSLTGHQKRYYTAQGNSVGVASANELEGLENRWFLGVKDEPIDVLVLLCRDKSEKLYDIVLPVQDLKGYWRLLSRSGGQIKFNIRREHGDFLLLVPGGKPVAVSKYIGNYQCMHGGAA